MGRRTLAGHKITFSKYRDRSAPASPADLDGLNAAVIFESWVREKRGEGIQEVSSQSYLRIDRVIRYNDHIVLVDTMAGKAGESGEVVNIENNEILFRLGEMDVPASPARAIFMCPPRGQMSLWFSEYSARSSGASMLLSQFDKEWKASEKGFTLTKKRLVASEIALDDATVTGVEVSLIKRADDRADGVDEILGTEIHKFKPSKKHRFLGSIINKFRDTPSSAYEMVGLSGSSYDEAEIFVSVDVGGHKRRVQIFNPEDGVYFREELNDSAHPILTHDELVEYCCENAGTFMERSGFEWLPDWSIGGVD